MMCSNSLPFSGKIVLPVFIENWQGRQPPGLMRNKDENIYLYTKRLQTKLRDHIVDQQKKGFKNNPETKGTFVYESSGFLKDGNYHSISDAVKKRDAEEKEKNKESTGRKPSKEAKKKKEPKRHGNGKPSESKAASKESRDTMDQTRTSMVSCDMGKKKAKVRKL